MGLLVAIADAVSAASSSLPSGPSRPDWMPEIGPWDLYGYLLVFAVLSTGFLGNWNSAVMTVPLVVWYIRYAGYQIRTCARSRACAVLALPGVRTCLIGSRAAVQRRTAAQRRL